MIVRPQHRPLGDPCSLCERPAIKHRVEHAPKGDPCISCGLPALNHTIRDQSKKKRSPDGRAAEQKRKHDKVKANLKYKQRIYVGMDGEGQGRQDHKYTMLCAADEKGDRKWFVENPRGLRTTECLEFLLSLPTERVRLFSYAFGYDLTKILTDLTNKQLYDLFRPELRQPRVKKNKYQGLNPVYFKGSNGHVYRLNMQGTKFTVKRPGKKNVTVWDVFKFFQGKFVGAIRDWKVGDDELWERMQLMKEQRYMFDKLTREEVQNYCFEECMCMGQLAHKLVAAHEAVDLKLTAFHGAGSSASAMLKKMGIRDLIAPPPAAMKHALSCGFFGGRFENSVIGEIPGPVWNYDISSAYPYQLCFLPCLMHGKWELTKDRKRIESARVSLVHYRLGTNASITDWGPFPYRTSDGSICFPIESGGGWVWSEEYLAGEKHFPHIQFVEAWVYDCDCACQPFAEVPKYYRERVRIGKEGPGIVLKLGLNSNYGKLAQSIGNAIFNSWIWAGLITSGTRAQMIEITALHKNRANLLMIATDGIYTRERLKPPKPRDTGTFDVFDAKKKKYLPLGGWEEKEVPQGVFVARPGIYFPMNPTDKDIAEVKGRGVGKGVVLKSHKLIVESWRKHGLNRTARVANVDRFCGAKTSITRSNKRCRVCRAKLPNDNTSRCELHPNSTFLFDYKRAESTGARRMRCKECDKELPKDALDCPTHPNAELISPSPSYGQWITREVAMGFDPMPKRAGVNKDGLTLTLRRTGDVDKTYPKRSVKGESAAYDRVVRSEERRELEAARDELYEQPDCDLTEYDLEEYYEAM